MRFCSGVIESHGGSKSIVAPAILRCLFWLSFDALGFTNSWRNCRSADIRRRLKEKEFVEEAIEGMKRRKEETKKDKVVQQKKVGIFFVAFACVFMRIVSNMRIFPGHGNAKELQSLGEARSRCSTWHGKQQ